MTTLSLLLAKMPFLPVFLADAGFFKYLQFNYLCNNMLIPLGIFLILTISLNLINGYCGMFSLGHQGFFAVGAYAAAAAVVYLGPESASITAEVHSLGAGIYIFGLSLIVGMIAAALSGLLIGIPCLRLKGDYLAIATLGFAEITRVVAVNVEAIGANRGMDIPKVLVQRSLREDYATYYVLYLVIVVVFVLLTLWIIWNIARSQHGRAIVAIREDETAAELLGVNLTRYKVLVFVIGAAFAGLAGALYANFRTRIAPNDFNLLIGVIFILLPVVLGGLGSLLGTVLATIFIYVGHEALKTRFFGILGEGPVGDFVAGWWQVLFALLLILVMIWRPQGFMGKKGV